MLILLILFSPKQDSVKEYMYIDSQLKNEEFPPRKFKSVKYKYIIMSNWYKISNEQRNVFLRKRFDPFL